MPTIETIPTYLREYFTHYFASCVSKGLLTTTCRVEQYPQCIEKLTRLKRLCHSWPIIYCSPSPSTFTVSSRCRAGSTFATLLLAVVRASAAAASPHCLSLRALAGCFHSTMTDGGGGEYVRGRDTTGGQRFDGYRLQQYCFAVRH